MRVVGDLEGQHRQRLGVGRVTLDFLVAVGHRALDGRNVDRRRQVVDHAIEQRLHALVLEGRATEHREHRDVAGALADQATQRLVVRHVAFEIGLSDFIVDLDDGLDQLARGTFRPSP